MNAIAIDSIGSFTVAHDLEQRHIVKTTFKSLQFKIWQIPEINQRNAQIPEQSLLGTLSHRQGLKNSKISRPGYGHETLEWIALDDLLDGSQNLKKRSQYANDQPVQVLWDT